MLFKDDEILEHIRQHYPGYDNYDFSDQNVAEEERFTVIRDIHRVDETCLNPDKDLFVRHLKPQRQTNTLNIRLLLDSLNADGSGLGDEIYKLIEKSNPLYSKFFIKNGINWVPLDTFFMVVNAIKDAVGNQNPRYLAEISKYIGLDKSVLDSSNVKLNLINLRSCYELLCYENRKANYDLLIQPVGTIEAKDSTGNSAMTTRLICKYFANFALHQDVLFDHEHYVYGILKGIAARKKRPFADIIPLCYPFDLHKLLRTEYARPDIPVQIADSIDQLIMVNQKAIARKVLVKKTHATGQLSRITQLLEAGLTRRWKPRRSAVDIIDLDNPIDLASISQAEAQDLVKEGNGFIVYQVLEDLIDKNNADRSRESQTHYILRKNEYFNCPYALTDVRYGSSGRAANRLDYGFLGHEEEVGGNMITNAFTGKKRQHLQMVRLFEVADEQRRAALEQKQKAEKQLEQFLLTMASAIESKDSYTGGHVERVAKYSLDLATRAGFSGEESREIYLGAMVHDIGKIGVKDSILNKRGRLDDEEMEIMRSHATIGKELLSQIDDIDVATIIAHNHQERFDGTGYPRGLKGEQIPVAARIVTIADYWDAIITDRPYRKAMDLSVAVELMHSERGKAFDPDLFDLFMADDQRLYLRYIDPSKLESVPDQE